MTKLSERMLEVMEKQASFEKGAADLAEAAEKLFGRAGDWIRENPELAGAGAGALAGGVTGRMIGDDWRSTLGGAAGGSALGAAIANVLKSDIADDERLRAPDNPAMVDFGEALLTPAKLAAKPLQIAARHPFITTGAVAGEMALASKLKERALADPSKYLHGFFKYFDDRAAAKSLGNYKWWKTLPAQLTGGNRRGMDIVTDLPDPNSFAGANVGKPLARLFGWASKGGPLRTPAKFVAKKSPVAAKAVAGAAGQRQKLVALAAKALSKVRL